ncbi:MAG: ABC transporter ATP-binding protein [Armatimonadota bacterium]|nr:ABC transporter ATP-binding protein [Armatimonadota bacterium]MDR7463303.1 ABC transporter ATP-binding protein [Armatimonadota bacterium]MDR7468963.1 ABC transporter ATP-binding protein [Armatimonadota bacterium]MDR7474008.1 ABC transporter ATP-binding protein [Armatimonadota bacterium]MDR7538003.1 ABC transporter ATP-binding protein [Armatimonadota bacterium]
MTARDGEILVVEGLHVAYGESRVLFDAHISVRRGQLVTCVGRNGAGKTTLLRTIAGFLRPTSGSVVFNGTNLIGLRPYQIARMGLKYVPQDKRVFSDLTVRENLELASYATGDYDWEPVFAHFPRLKQLLDHKGGYLSGGERQMLMIGRALLGRPSLLLIDEPTEGLAPSLVDHLKEVLRELSKTTTLVIVEQNLPLVSAISDKVYAVREGHIVAEISDPEAIRANVCERYL